VEPLADDIALLLLAVGLAASVRRSARWSGDVRPTSQTAALLG